MSGNDQPRPCPSFEAGLDALRNQAAANPAPDGLDDMIRVP